jgi:hypothetical protein
VRKECSILCHYETVANLRGARTGRFIAALKTARHRSLSWSSRIQSTPSQPISLSSILIPSSYLRFGLPSGVFPSGLPTKSLRITKINMSVLLVKRFRAEEARKYVLQRNTNPGIQLAGMLWGVHTGRAMAQTASDPPLTAEARVSGRASPCGICGGQSGTGTGFSLNSSVFPYRYHSTGSPY